ncbi:carboxylating nicotinate-nucleotide diphosphorylase [Prolixibacteraceae bacterium JC049]|nr:carboxylating nicotinate-nucleotide diphosphorylase [Prolixibacteraceae bacterium JC049]
MNKLEFKDIEPLIDKALEEDISIGDVTTDNLIPADSQTKATMTAKAEGVVAGLDVAEWVFKKLDANVTFTRHLNDGDRVKRGMLIAEIEGSFRALLSGERVALNFLQRMSGVASATVQYVDAIKNYKTEILDTRKTLPGYRSLDKYSVAAGGGMNHRIGLYDMVMIKDNHIKVAGSITNAVNEIRPKIADGIKIEVETTNLDEVKEALAAKADVIMLDNMDNTTMTEAVQIINGAAKVEASGNMNLARVKEVAETGVDFISIGALTHSVMALDISQNIEM